MLLTKFKEHTRYVPSQTELNKKSYNEKVNVYFLRPSN